jgi:hypothetical protein
LLSLNQYSNILATNAIYMEPEVAFGKGSAMLHFNKGLLPLDKNQWYLSSEDQSSTLNVTISHPSELSLTATFK